MPVCAFRHLHQSAQQVPTATAHEELFGTREKAGLWQLCSFLQLEKELLSFQRHPPSSSRTGFLQEELSSIDTTKRKILKMHNFDTNLQRITPPHGAVTTLLQKHTHSLAFSSPRNSQARSIMYLSLPKVHTSGDELASTGSSD